MPKPRGRRHTTLTETADLVVRELEKLPDITMIAPGEIRTAARGRSARHLTIVATRAGYELIITGQSVQKVAVHATIPLTVLVDALQTSKALRGFTIATRERKPGV
jgi:hypothetical protein